MQHARAGLTGLPRGRPAAATKSRFRRGLTAGSVLLLATLTAATVTSPAAAAPASASVDKQVQAEIAANGSTQFLVYLKDRADLSQAATQPSKASRGQYVYQQLTAMANSSQRGLADSLKGAGVKYQSYWIANALAVTGDKKVLDSIATRTDVKSIEAVKVRPIVEPQVTPASSVNAVEWGVQNIDAPRVWNEIGVRGEGIVVANIDSGVQYNHPAVVGKYRGNLGNGQFDHNYNWFDPAQVCGSPSIAPCDNNGHGTHTMGTMVGDDGAGNQIGVAPGAKWIAAKGCETNGCSDTSLLASGQWVIAPTDLSNQNPRPDLHPDVVNNSWGGGQADTFYQETVRAWTAAGIMPIFSNGNSGPSCNTANSPGDLPETYSVGAYDINNNIASFSSRGTSQLDGAIKPNIAAPGVNVRSSVPNNSYALFSGTSMAAPHVSGTVALIWSAAPTLRGDIAATRALLNRTATDVDSLGCGGTVAFNNNFGEGRLNAFQAVSQAPRGPIGRIIGKVTDSATGAAISGVSVVAETVSATTGADGTYSLTVAAGSHTVTASKFGYATQSATVAVAEGSATTQNFALVALPNVTVSGRVLDGSGHGWPLYAKIEVTGRPGAPVYTNPATGAYSFTVPSSTTYSLTTTALYPGYQPKTESLAVGTTNLTHDIAVAVAPSCTAAGYAVNLGTPVLSQSFDTTSTPAGWSVFKRGPTGGQWAFNDPGGRGNLTGGSGNFAIGDSDAAGSGTFTDTDLITPVLNLTGLAAPTVRFNSDFRDLGDEDFADVDYTTDGGTTWTHAWHQPDTRRGPRVEEVSLAAVAGQSNVQLRFHYAGSWDWWWEIDNVAIVNRSCDPVPGGLVVGFTSDSNTGAALNGVTVTSTDNTADKGVSAATPDDPNIGDGFYWLFSHLTGAHGFTAAKSPYQAVTKSVNVPANGAVQADFALKGAKLTVAPTSIEAFQTMGQTKSTSVTVTNTGNAPAQVEFLERSGSFNILGQGAPLQTVKIPGGVSKAMTAKGPLPLIKRPNNAVTVGSAWTAIDSTPAPLADNAAAWVNGKVYSVGGANGTGSENAFLVFDPTTGHWTAGPNLPHARSKPSATQIAGKLYVIGGWDTDGTPVPSVDVYDPATNAWSTLSATNPKPAAAAGTAVVNGKVYLVGGCTTSSCAETAEAQVFDPNGSGSFASIAPYPHSVSWMGCGGVGSKAYCAGGVADSTFTDGFSYDPAANAWTPIAAMPVDIWAPQEAAANGMLVFAGGIAENSSGLTNRTIGYDVASDRWMDLPNVNFPRARGAGACGMYKIGGWDGPFSPAAQAESLSGLEQCADASDVPWLSEDPATFTLAPGASKKVNITLAATPEAGVTQPGDYTAQLMVRSDSPYPVDSVQVKLHVLPPANWGKITGRVQGQSCSGNVVGLPAQLQLNLASNPDVGYSLKAGADGTYALWLPKGRYQTIVSKDGWVSQVKTLKIEAGFVLNQDFLLTPFGGCAASGRGSSV